MIRYAQAMSTAHGGLERPHSPFALLYQFNFRKWNVVLKWRIVSPDLKYPQKIEPKEFPNSAEAFAIPINTCQSQICGCFLKEFCYLYADYGFD